MLKNPRFLRATLPALPLQNQLLSELPAEDWHALRAGFEDVQLSAGTTLYEAGSVLRHVYFPTTAVVSLTSTMQSGATAEVAVVGRGSEANIRIEDAGVSRRHAEVRREGDEVFLVDLGSTNGTTVNGRAIERVRLSPGDRISIGRTVLNYERDDG